MTLSPVTKYTRAPAHGRAICCPECSRAAIVYHFAWSAITCQHCGNMSNKPDWMAYPSKPTKRLNMPLSEVARYIGFDYGEAISSKNLRHEGNWLFLKRPGMSDVDCFALPCGPYCFEPWSDIPAAKSAFAPSRKTDPATLAKLDAEYVAYLRSYDLHCEADDFLYT